MPSGARTRAFRSPQGVLPRRGEQLGAGRSQLLGGALGVLDLERQSHWRGDAPADLDLVHQLRLIGRRSSSVAAPASRIAPFPVGSSQAKRTGNPSTSR